NLASFIVAIPNFHQLQWVGFLSNLIFDYPYLFVFILFPLSILFFITSHFIVGQFSFIYRCHSKLSSTSMGGIFI
ncbi:hypothetical protein, partial [Staphylococcus aureus]|uniref:hypothetical protein n=1 Tax=Staphylococcus aureus TaxID=1280 RepID=UPI001C40A7DB